MQNLGNWSSALPHVLWEGLGTALHILWIHTSPATEGLLIESSRSLIWLTHWGGGGAESSLIAIQFRCGKRGFVVLGARAFRGRGLVNKMRSGGGELGGE